MILTEAILDAAKETTDKALGTGDLGEAWRDLPIALAEIQLLAQLTLGAAQDLDDEGHRLHSLRNRAVQLDPEFVSRLAAQAAAAEKQMKRLTGGKASKAEWLDCSNSLASLSLALFDHEL